MNKQSGRLHSIERVGEDGPPTAGTGVEFDRLAFVERMRQAAASAALEKDRDPARIADIYANIVDGCLEFSRVAERVESRYLQVVVDLCLGWIALRQAAGAHPAESATRLLAWASDERRGLCDGLLCEAVEVLDPPGRDALAQSIRVRWDVLAADMACHGNPPEASAGVQWQRWNAALRSLYRAQDDAAGFIAIAEATGPTVRDCHAIGTMLATQDQAGAALEWTGRGIDLDRASDRGSLAGCELAKLQRRLLAGLGRADEACVSAWAAYRANPCKYAYDELMLFVPDRRRLLWHRWAVVAARCAEINAGVELLLETKELGCLADFVVGRRYPSLERAGGYSTVRAAVLLEGSRPDAAARLWAWQAMQIVDAARSDYNHVALRYFKRARHCFESIRQTADWDRTVEFVRRRFARKDRLMADFENIVRAEVGPATPLCCL